MLSGICRQEHDMLFPPIKISGYTPATFRATSLLLWPLHKWFVTSGVRRKFPRGRQSFVTIVWRHKSTLWGSVEGTTIL